MYKLSLLFSLLITLTINAKTGNNSELNNSALEFIALEINQFELENSLFSDLEDITLNVEDIEVVELEEDVDINFDTTQYLPENFNALAGKNDIDWSKIELVELEEEVELGFNTKDYLPENFNPYQGIDCKQNAVESLY
ncbi:MAG: hypothetical protein R2816_00365 [Flavobacteriaceae bacterium]|nr:hypothetical protein [Flavobacteriaceae bacterium]